MTVERNVVDEASTGDFRSDLVGQVEARGIEFIPESERHGRPRELFAVWAGSNASYLYVVSGGVLILLGLNVWQSLAVLLVGNLTWVLTGLLAVSGPASGTSCTVVSRSMLGPRANKVNVAVTGWMMAVASQVLSLSIGALSGVALVEYFGLTSSAGVQIIIVLAISAATLTISVYGHATIVRFGPWFTGVLTTCLLVLAFFVLQHMNLGYTPAPADAPHGVELWAAISVGFTLTASAGLAWTNGADYSRYLPSTTSMRAVAFWTALGGFVPAILLGSLGVLAGTIVDMTDPLASLTEILPGWFYPVFLCVIMVGATSTGVLIAYSAGLALQALGVPWKRSVTVLFDGAVSVTVCLYALFGSQVIPTLSTISEMSVTLFGPAMAIYAVDILLRRNRYDGPQLLDQSPNGMYWYRGGVNWAGATAQLAGTTLSLMCVNTTHFTGPISTALGGIDLSVPVALITAGGIYALGSRSMWSAAGRR